MNSDYLEGIWIIVGHIIGNALPAINGVISGLCFLGSLACTLRILVKTHTSGFDPLRPLQLSLNVFTVLAFLFHFLGNLKPVLDKIWEPLPMTLPSAMVISMVCYSYTAMKSAKTYFYLSFGLPSVILGACILVFVIFVLESASPLVDENAVIASKLVLAITLVVVSLFGCYYSFKTYRKHTSDLNLGAFSYADAACCFEYTLGCLISYLCLMFLVNVKVVLHILESWIMEVQTTIHVCDITITVCLVLVFCLYTNRPFLCCLCSTPDRMLTIKDTSGDDKSGNESGHKLDAVNRQISFTEGVQVGDLAIPDSPV